MTCQDKIYDIILTVVTCKHNKDKERRCPLVDLKDQFKAMAKAQGMTFKELADKASMSEKGLHNKFNRESITFKDVQRLLAVLGKTIEFKDKP